MKTIVTVTVNPALDVTAGTDRVVADRKLRCGRPRREPGGGGLNVSRVIAALGGSSSAFFFAGGTAGEELRERLSASGIDCRPVGIDDDTRRNLTVLEENTGCQYRFVLPGPRVGEDDCERLLEMIAAHRPPPDYLVASGSLPPGAPDDFYRRLAGTAAGVGARVVVDSSKEALRQALGEAVYLIKPNLRELKHLIGGEIGDEGARAEAARDLIAGGRAEVVVVSLGGAGALLVTADSVRRIRAPVVDIDSRVGAGDSMVGGLVLALARGESLESAARFGVAAGSAAVMTPGTELCRREDTERLYRQLRDG